MATDVASHASPAMLATLALWPNASVSDWRGTSRNAPTKLSTRRARTARATVGRYRIAEFLEPPGDRAAATLHVGVGPTTGAGRGVRIEVCPVGVPNQRRDQPDERIRRAPGHADGAERGQRQHSDTVSHARVRHHWSPSGLQRKIGHTDGQVPLLIDQPPAGRGDELGKIRWPVDKSIGNEPNHPANAR